MPEVLIISGKGGTGKTSLTAAFAHLVADPVICDLDVDAPDLHLLLQPRHRQTRAFHAGHEARIHTERCEACGLCRELCRFDAVTPGDNVPSIDPLKCEGCKVCVHFCPASAIDFISKHCGQWFVSDTRFGPMVHAQLFPAEENSGRLVALLRQKARQIAQERGHKLVLSDGPPGIGCPVISALAGVQLAVIVTEPTPSGRHDLERVLALCDHFKVPAAVIINKCDLNRPVAARIRTDCRRKGLPVVAELPHDALFVQAMIQGQTVTEFSHGALRRQLEQAWDHIGRLASADSRPQRPADTRSVSVKNTPAVAVTMGM